MSKYVFRPSISAVLLLLMVFVTASAQEFRGSLAGNVTDPNGAALPGATVTIKNVETNVENTATTNDDGSYSFPLLMPGQYTLTVTAQGFGTTTNEGIQIRVAEKLTLDVQVQVAGVGETVTTIASQGPALETGSVSTGTVVESKQIQELPLAEGTAYQLATLAPGISYTGNPQFAGPTSNGNLAAFRSNGAIGSNQITLDGSPNYAFEGGVGFSPPSDAVQEFKVQTNAFDAQQGYSAGATVNVAVRSGTNEPHGSLYYFNRDRSRTANNFFSNRAGLERPERTYHRYGGVLHGPVYIPKVYNGRDKTFFLFSYERLKDNISEPQLFIVPTEAMRRGDFSSLIVDRSNINAILPNGQPANTIIYNPFSARQVGNNVVRESFGCPTSGPVPANSTCNIIPANLINPIASAFLSYYPLPNTTPIGVQNFFSPQNRIQNYRAWLTRIDHTINQNQRIFGKYYHSFNPEDRQNWAGVVNSFPVTQGFEDRTNDGGNIDYTHTLSSSMVLDLRVSFNRFQQERRPAATFDPATLGFSQQSLALFRGYNYLPNFQIRNLDATRPQRSNLGAARSDFNLGRTRPYMMGTIQPTVTQIFGNHTARYGYDLRIVRENFSSARNQGGRLFFDGTFTRQASNSGTAAQQAFGRDIAAFLLGVPASGEIDNPSSYSVQSLYHGGFFHDDWRVTPKLTLNMGLRYEVETGVTERFNRLVRGFDLTTPSPVDAAARAAYTAAYNANPGNFPLTPDQFRVLGGYTFAGENNRAAWNTEKNLLQPRFGVAYQVNDRTVLRGGFGIFVAPFQIEAPRQVGFAGNTPFVATNNNGLTVVTLSNLPAGFGSGLQESPGASQGLLTSTGVAVASSGDPIFPFERKHSKFARLIVGVQRELPGQFIVEANYVSAWGYDLPVSRNLNFIPRQFLATDPATDAMGSPQRTFLEFNLPNPFRGLLPGGSPFNTAANLTRGNLLRPFPQFGDVWLEEYNGSNRYNSLQLQAQKRFARDLSFTGSYTYSKLKEKVNYLNPSDTELEERFSPDDRPHRFTIATVYQLPLGRDRLIGRDMPRVLDFFIGGWQVNGTYEWQSGEPFTLNNPLYFAGDLSQVSSRNGQKDEQGRIFGIDRPAFDTSGFVRLASFQALRNVPTTLPRLRNQPFSVANLSLTKNFNVNETMRFQIRAEALNAFNKPYFGGTNSVNLDPNNAAFGFVSGQRNNPRDIQLGVKFVF